MLKGGIYVFDHAEVAGRLLGAISETSGGFAKTMKTKQQIAAEFRVYFSGIDYLLRDTLMELYSIPEDSKIRPVYDRWIDDYIGGAIHEVQLIFRFNYWKVIIHPEKVFVDYKRIPQPRGQSFWTRVEEISHTMDLSELRQF